MVAALNFFRQPMSISKIPFVILSPDGKTGWNNI
jgi:hypothetical protein